MKCLLGFRLASKVHRGQGPRSLRTLLPCMAADCLATQAGNAATLGEVGGSRSQVHTHSTAAEDAEAAPSHLKATSGKTGTVVTDITVEEQVCEIIQKMNLAVNYISYY